MILYLAMPHVSLQLMNLVCRVISSLMLSGVETLVTPPSLPLPLLPPYSLTTICPPLSHQTCLIICFYLRLFLSHHQHLHPSLIHPHKSPSSTPFSLHPPPTFPYNFPLSPKQLPSSPQLFIQTGLLKFSTPIFPDPC